MARSRTPKSIAITVRVSAEEKAAFDRAAEIAGISFSSWIRERLRAASLRELDLVGELAPFLTEKPRGKSNG
jgi:uncharacterized protein (DUF1778 family)